MNEDFEITSNISISSIYRKSFEEFLKNSIRLIINSRKKNNSNQIRTLSFTTDIIDNQIDNSSFLFEDLSFDSISTITNSKIMSKNQTIDFYLIKNNIPKLLIERWNFSFYEENNFKSEIYVQKKLVSLIRTIYSITRILPANKLKNMDNFIIDFQSYQKYKGEKFILEQKELIHIFNKKINHIDLTVEYLTNEQIENYFNQKDDIKFKKVTKKKSNRNVRFYSISFGKKKSYEILNFEEEKPILDENYFSIKNYRKLSYDEETKKEKSPKNKNKKVMYKSFDLNDDLELIESEDNDDLNYNITEENENESRSSIYKNLRAKNINEENNKSSSSGTKSSNYVNQFKRMSRFKTSDTIDSNSSNSNLENNNENYSFELNIISDEMKNENVYKTIKLKKINSKEIYRNVRNKFFELKDKILISRNEGFNINKLYTLINELH